MNLPNSITVIRLLLIPVFIALFYIEFSGHYFVAAALFAVAAFTDYLDGYFARKLNLVTDLGKFLDASADKVLVLAALVIMIDAKVVPPVWGGALTAVILAREIMVSCLRMVAASKNVVLAADIFGKIKTVLQDVGIIVAIVAAGLNIDVVTYIGYAILSASVIMTIVSGVRYFIVNRKVLVKDKNES